MNSTTDLIERLDANAEVCKKEAIALGVENPKLSKAWAELHKLMKEAITALSHVMPEDVQKEAEFLRWEIETRTEYDEKRCKRIADLLERLYRENAFYAAKCPDCGCPSGLLAYCPWCRDVNELKQRIEELERENAALEDSLNDFIDRDVASKQRIMGEK